MKYGWLRRGLILLAALGLCFGMVWYSRERPQPKAEGLTLWYAESDFSPAVMDSLLAKCLKETGLQIEPTAFPDEVSLGEAFAAATPDLLFCSHIRAAQLDGRGSLSMLPEALPVPDSLSEAPPTVGSSFFPIGSRLPLLLINTSLTTDSFESLESMLNKASDSPFLVCDRRSDFLYAQAAAAGIQLSGILEQDMKDTRIASLYNQMALAVFRGHLVFRDNPVDYVRQGLIPAAVAPSSALAGIPGGEMEVRYLPLPEGADTRYPAELMGFALIDGADIDTAKDFFQWLWSLQSAETALKAGLVPTVKTNSSKYSENSLEALLCSLQEGGLLFLLDVDEPFVRNRESMEQWLCEALDLLM